MSRRSIAIAVIAVCVLALAAIAMAADDPFNGTWMLNVAKSTSRPGGPPASLTNRFDLRDGVLKRVEDVVRADGTVRHQELTAILDDKDHPVADNPGVDAYRASRIDSHTIVIVLKKGGSEVGTARHALSKDGKTMTLTQNRKNDQGQETAYTDFYEKQ